MKENNYKYSQYVPLGNESRWATREEIRRSGLELDLRQEHYAGGGLPLLSDGVHAVVDDADTHTLIFGATGSKKTRLFCMPLLNILVRAGESFVATDPKGELCARTSGIARENGYRIVVLNFRDIGRGDMWNPLALPFSMYRAGRYEEAVSLLNDFVSVIAEPQFQNANDRFWPEMASSLALANLLLLMEYGTQETVHMSSMASLCTGASEVVLENLAAYMPPNSLAGINYGGIFGAAENTKKSIYATLFGMLRIFIANRSLSRMLSGNTVDIRRFGEEKTAVYIIVPDEKSATHFLVTAFVKQVYEILIGEAQQHADKRLPVRVNFVLDEFCNLPKFPDMPSMISAARSRNMRFFLVAQSLHQLRGKYGEDADTIKGNCDNWVFLTSRELDLLREISELCGTVREGPDTKRPLISVSELQRLDKARGEALIMHARQYPIITEMADIDMYETFRGYPEIAPKPFDLPDPPLFPLAEFYRSVKLKREILHFPI